MINQYTRYLTVALAVVQSWAIARGPRIQPGYSCSSPASSSRSPPSSR